MSNTLTPTLILPWYTCWADSQCRIRLPWFEEILTTIRGQTQPGMEMRLVVIGPEQVLPDIAAFWPYALAVSAATPPGRLHLLISLGESRAASWSKGGGLSYILDPTQMGNAATRPACLAALAARIQRLLEDARRSQAVTKERESGPKPIS